MKDQHTSPLFVDTIEDALREAVKGMGGAKSVGARMRPEKLSIDAGMWLSDCLNVDKRDKLSLEQVMWIVREARQAGCHIAMHFICESAGYEAAKPVEPEDEKAKLMRDFIEATKQQTRNVEKMEQLAGIKLRVAA